MRVLHAVTSSIRVIGAGGVVFRRLTRSGQFASACRLHFFVMQGVKECVPNVRSGRKMEFWCNEDFRVFGGDRHIIFQCNSKERPTF